MRWLMLVLLLATAAPAEAEDPPKSAHMMVAAGNPLAAEAGMSILRAGGTAVDAAIAAQLVLSVTEPQSTGIAGGGFLLFYDAPTHAVSVWDGWETAPAAARPDMFLKPDGAPMAFADVVLGGRTVGVPGLMRMLEAAQHAHGHAQWASLFAAAIKSAEDGFSVTPRLAAAIAANPPALQHGKDARDLFMPDGKPPKPGDTLINKPLADTLHALATQSADAMMKGPIAADVARAVRTDGNPGLLTADDLAAYQPRLRTPVCASYRAHRICGAGPPSSGGISVLQMLGLLTHFDVPDLDPTGVDAAHLLAETGRLAMADRDLYLADADFVPVPAAGLLAPEYLGMRAQLIDPDHAMAPPRAGNPSWDWPPAQPAQPEHGTSQIVVIDAQGNAVSLTTTIGESFGSGILVDGFLLNTALADFSFMPTIDGRPVANRVQPGKRSRNSAAPVFVLSQNGMLQAALGSTGGADMPAYVTQALLGLLDWRLDPGRAVSLPHVATEGNTVRIEDGPKAADLAAALRRRGHDVSVQAAPSGTMAVVITANGLLGAADPRGEGVALGE